MAISYMPEDESDEPRRRQLLTALGFLLGVSKNTAIFLGIGLLAMFVGLFIVAGYLLIIAEPVTPELLKQSVFKVVENPMNRSQNFELTINLHSQTLGAQDKIIAYVKLEPNGEERQTFNASGYRMPDEYRIWFDGTYCQDSGDTYARMYPCYLQLTSEPQVDKSWWNVHWRGNKTLNYSIGGVFDVMLGNQSSLVHEAQRTGNGFITIEGIEATNSFAASQQSAWLATRSLGVSFLGLASSLVVIYLSFLGFLGTTRKRKKLDG